MAYESLFDTIAAPLRARTQLRALPGHRETGWRPLQPHQWPNLSGCSFISHDTENHEKDFDYGAGWSRGKVDIVGHSITAYWGNESRSFYLPKKHTVDTHLNLPPTAVDQYIHDSLANTPHIPKGYANAIYDVGTTAEDNAFVVGELHEVQFAEALISEDENVDLDTLAKKYLDDAKDTNELYEWCAAAFGGNPTRSQRANIYRTSPKLVGPYAEQDSALILPILLKQWPIMQQEGLLDLYRMECDLIRLLIRMRRQGVRIDLDRTYELEKMIAAALKEKIAQFKHLTGIDTTSSVPTGDIAKAFDALGLPYRITEKTKKPSITADDLKVIPHPVAKLALEIRQHGKIESTFIRGTLLDRHVNGIVHCSFEPLRNVDGGARTGRFVSNNPNLQTIPARTELGKQIRTAFVPFEGHMCYRKTDFSQYEYRILSHYAVGPGSDELRERYRNDPRTDYHDVTGEMIRINTGKQLERKPTKTINFGLMNAMGVDLLAAELGISTKEALPLLEAYHNGNPYVKATIKACSDEAQEKGYITTILGRRRRFNLWEPAKNEWDDVAKKFIKVPALRFNHATAVYGHNIKRAKTHTALNSRTQGTNADGIKKAMVQCHKEGLFDIVGVPTLTVHDELNWSQIDDSPIQLQAYARIEWIMENAIPLSIPVRVDTGTGANWGVIK